MNAAGGPHPFSREINGRRLVGTMPFEDLKMVVEHEIAYAKVQKKATDCCSVQLALPGMGPVPK